MTPPRLGVESIGTGILGIWTVTVDLSRMSILFLLIAVVYRVLIGVIEFVYHEEVARILSRLRKRNT